MPIIEQPIKAIATGTVVAAEMEGPSWPESSCFFRREKLELLVCEGKGGGGCAGLEQQRLLAVEVEPLPTNGNDSAFLGFAFVIFTRPF